MEREELGVRRELRRRVLWMKGLGFDLSCTLSRLTTRLLCFTVGVKGPARELAAALVYQRHFKLFRCCSSCKTSRVHSHWQRSAFFRRQNSGYLWSSVCILSFVCLCCAWSHITNWFCLVKNSHGLFSHGRTANGHSVPAKKKSSCPEIVYNIILSCFLIYFREKQEPAYFWYKLPGKRGSISRLSKCSKSSDVYIQVTSSDR